MPNPQFLVTAFDRLKAAGCCAGVILIGNGSLFAFGCVRGITLHSQIAGLIAMLLYITRRTSRLHWAQILRDRAPMCLSVGQGVYLGEGPRPRADWQHLGLLLKLVGLWPSLGAISPGDGRARIRQCVMRHGWGPSLSRRY